MSDRMPGLIVGVVELMDGQRAIGVQLNGERWSLRPDEAREIANALLTCAAVLDAGGRLPAEYPYVDANDPAAMHRAAHQIQEIQRRRPE